VKFGLKTAAGVLAILPPTLQTGPPKRPEGAISELEGGKSFKRPPFQVPKLVGDKRPMRAESRLKSVAVVDNILSTSPKLI
jgi:hypothetical protein